MDYEKAYKEALERARDYYKANLKLDEADENLVLEDIFPELAEYEGKRIREKLIDTFNFYDPAMNSPFLLGIHKKDILAWLKKQESVGEIVERCKTSWYNEGKIQGQIEGLSDEEKYQQGWHDALEKQGEQILANSAKTGKTKPKFHEGQWIVWQDKCYKVNYNGCGYELVDQNGLSTSLEYGTVDENAHIWDITKDARVGDVLASKDKSNILIFKNLDTSTSFSSYYNTAGKGELGWSNECFIPATKEQRNQLEKAMVNAGYTFDFEKKEPKKIEQMSSWSEEDKNFMYDTLSNLTELKDRYGEGYGNVGKCIGWLKTLKERYTWKPSDEQMKALRDLNLTGNISYAGQGQTLIELYNDLKKLKG